MDRQIQMSIDEMDKSIENLIEDFKEYIQDKAQNLKWIVEDLEDYHKECDWDSMEYEIENLKQLCDQMFDIN